jgi:hypothetical protein
MYRKYESDGKGSYRGIFWFFALFGAGQTRLEKLAGAVRLCGSSAESPAEDLRKAGR